MEKHGFELVYSSHLKDFNVTGSLWRHIKTGMEVFHVDTDDPESFFCFSFRTLPYDSSGVFHILEHTVLSGSRKYPAHDPFSLFDARSCNSYMNALTCPDRTLYPAASPVKKDADNIFSLYADSCFSPLLRRSDFESEGIRKGKNGFEGVVFNEMRGDALQCDTLVSNHSRRDLFRGTPYAFSSGGDVKEMARLTYDEYLKAYEKFYSPSNCRLFIYSDADTFDSRLAFLDEEYLSRMSAGEKIASPPPAERWSESESKTILCQASGPEDRGDFMLSFLTESRSWVPYDNIFVSVLVDALLGGPANPLYAALLSSGLGQDISDQSGMSADFAEIPFAVGLCGVRQEDVPRAQEFIMDSLCDIATAGIGDDIIEASLRRQEFLVQEVAGGIPNGFRFFLKCIRAWERGEYIPDALCLSSTLEKLRADFKANPRLFEDWMMRNLVNNPHRLSLYVKPSQDCIEKEEEELMRIWRQRADDSFSDEKTPASDYPLPSLSLSDIPESESDIRLDRVSDNFLFETENTCGISYINQVTDLGDLSSDELVYAIILSRYILTMGAGGLTPAAFHSRLRLESGGYYAYLETGRTRRGDVRVFFTVRIKCLTRRLNECLSLLHDMIFSPDMDNMELVTNAVNDIITDYESYVEESASSFAGSLAQASLTPSCSLGEKLMGISCWKRIKDLSVKEIADGMKRVISLFSQKEREILHLTSEERAREESVREGLAFLSSFKESGAFRGNVIRQIEEKSRRIWCPLPSSVCYNAMALRASAFISSEQEAEAVLMHILSSTTLWRRLRSDGGAYGADASLDNMEQTVVITTYRDPNAAESFDEIVRALEETDVTDEAVETAKMITFGRFLKPLSPGQKSTLSLRRFMYGISDEMRRKRRLLIRQVSVDDVIRAKERILGSMKDASLASLSPESVFTRNAPDGFTRRNLP